MYYNIHSNSLNKKNALEIIQEIEPVDKRISAMIGLGKNIGEPATVISHYNGILKANPAPKKNEAP